MKITEEMAILLDKILSSSLDDGEDLDLPDDDIDLYITLGDILSENGLGKWLGGNCFMVYPQGKVFIQHDSFHSRFVAANKQIEEDNRYKKEQLELTSRQIKAAKREPWLILWGIITTITTIVLAILQLINS